jgi:exonuclease III
MKILMWNVRGLGKPARRRQVREYILHENIDFIGLQETIKQDFSESILRDLAGSCNVSWFWSPSYGHSGGILVNVQGDILEVENHTARTYSIQTTIRNRLTNFKWDVVMVYGPTHHDFSLDFLAELSDICSHSGLPLVLGGDFNLIRSEDEKNSENYNQQLMDSFNNFIGDHHLREVTRAGPKFT